MSGVGLCDVCVRRRVASRCVPDFVHDHLLDRREYVGLRYFDAVADRRRRECSVRRVAGVRAARARPRRRRRRVPPRRRRTSSFSAAATTRTSFF